jgi:hypothetical protein
MRFWRTWQMGTVLVVLVSAGLVAWRYLPGSPTKHFDGEGPLSASSGHGGFTALDRRGTWYVAAAGNILCLTDPGDPVTLTGVRHDAVVEPLALRTLVRTVNAEELAAARRPGHRLREGLLIGTAVYREPTDRQRELSGTLDDDVAGTVVRQPCSAQRESPNGLPDEGFTELVFEMKVGRAGAVVPTTYVDYTRGRRAYTLVVDWEMGMCGTRAARVLEPGDC